MSGITAIDLIRELPFGAALFFFAYRYEKNNAVFTDKITVFLTEKRTSMLIFAKNRHFWALISDELPIATAGLMCSYNNR